MIIIDNTEFTGVVQNELVDKSMRRLSAMAGTADVTLEKILNGDTDVNLTTVDRIADYFGFDVEMKLIRRRKAAA